MLLYRVHPWIDGVGPAEPFGALYIPHGQGVGRWDNPELYSLRYFSTTPDGAIAETFGHLASWSSEMLLLPGHPDAARALSTYEIPDACHLADLADPDVLQTLGVHRVTDVSERNKRRMQRLAAKIFEQGEWDGISWWSSYHPSITLVATWLQGGISCTWTEPLSIESAPVEETARRIVRTARRPRDARRPGTGA